MLILSCFDPVYENVITEHHGSAADQPGGDFRIGNGTEADHGCDHESKHATDHQFHAGSHHGDHLSLKALDAHAETHGHGLCPNEKHLDVQHGLRHKYHAAVIRIGDQLYDLSAEEKAYRVSEHIEQSAQADAGPYAFRDPVILSGAVVLRGKCSHGIGNIHGRNGCEHANFLCGSLGDDGIGSQGIDGTLNGNGSHGKDRIGNGYGNSYREHVLYNGAGAPAFRKREPHLREHPEEKDAGQYRGNEL